MKKLYFNKDGWICDRYPYNFTSHDIEKEVEDKDYYKTFSCNANYCWRLVDNKLIMDKYDKIAIKKEELKEELRRYEEWFKIYDNQIKENERCKRVNIEYDNKYGTIEELDSRAIQYAKRITEIKGQLK